MRILYKEPGKAPRTMVIAQDLGIMQQLVDGYIEPIRISDKTVLIVNEEGKLRKMDPNFILAVEDKVELIVGPAIFCGENGEDFASLPKDELDQIMDCLKKGDFVL